MAASKMKEMLQKKEDLIGLAIFDLEVQIAAHCKHVSRDQLRCWNKRIQGLRSLRITIRTMISMVD